MRAVSVLVRVVASAASLLACSSSEIIGSSYVPPGSGAGGASAEAGSAPSAGGAGTTNGGSASSGSSPVAPSTSNYDEPYRGQFHFSPESMWMGVIDGLWFHDGTYHLAYQANPYAFVQSRDEHWAHATSPDLLHWQHEPYLLVPGRNVVGEPWAGSVVVDSANTAGLQTGDAPTFIAVFTDTGVGTSLAYSNDLGGTWQAYAGNPLAIGDADYETNRDPVVVWHEATKRWLCAYWQDGITFYTSPDLKTWTKRGNVSWGSLVPDLYELPLDGNANDTRWVLQDASGRYLVGQHDGESFVPDAGGTRLMDVGPSFFAARTSFRETFPGRRAVQMAWLRNGGVLTAPAQGDATFPAELALRTFPEGVRLTRTPIAEIESLYGASKHFEPRTLAAGQNLLTGIEAKAFDLELVLDDDASQAAEIELRIADKSIVYDRTAHTLLGHELAPLDGRVQLRVLADHGQLEIFGNAGQLSYSESFGFAPDDASISLTANGNVSLLSVDFREVRRVWPGSPALRSRVVDDVEPELTYAGTWSQVDDDPTYVQQTCHVSKEAEAYVELTFTGTRVDWYGLLNADLGVADVFIDGARVAEIDCYGETRTPRLLFSKSQLPNTFHTIRVQVSGKRNAASTGAALVHDYFIYSTEAG